MTSLPEIIHNGINTFEETSNTSIGNIFHTLFNQHGLNHEQFWKPPVDIIDSVDHITIYMDIPGITPSKLNVDFYNNQIKISGLREKPYSTSPSKNEIMYGEFIKKLTLPISVTNKESVIISAENGVLSIIINKANEEKNRFSLNIL
jgi:HSP20 family protein